MTDKRKTLLVRIATAVAMAVTITLFFGTYHDWIDVTFTALVTAVLTVAFGGLADRQDAKLTARMQAGDLGEWEAWLNGIRLGTISDADYAAMQRVVFRDGHVAIMQIWNVGWVALVLLKKLVLCLPFIAFWLAIGLAFVAPESYSNIARDLQTADPATITVVAKKLLEVGLVFALVIFGALFASGYRFGFRNCYSDCVGRLVRQHFNTPVEGDITLCRPVQLRSASA